MTIECHHSGIYRRACVPDDFGQIETFLCFIIILQYDLMDEVLYDSDCMS